MQFAASPTGLVEAEYLSPTWSSRMRSGTDDPSPGRRSCHHSRVKPWPGLLALLLLAAACREAVRPLAPDPASRDRPDDLLSALAARFGPMEREPTFDALRPKLARAALVPSRVYDDGAAWTAARGEERTVEFHGRTEAGRYLMGVTPGPPPPEAPGAYRARLDLRRIAEGRFEWRMREELAVGAVSGRELAAAATVLFRAAEKASESEARRAIGSSLPRACAAFGRLVSLDALRLEPAADGATEVTVGLRLRPEGIEDTAPRYAEFLRRYVTPVELEAAASDDEERVWWEVEMRENRATLRFRVRGGHLAPPAATPGRIPGRLRLRADYSTRAGIFRIGVRDLHADLHLVREENEIGFVARFLRPPDWRLPFLIEPFMRGSLLYPFEGEGSSLGLAVRDQPGVPTLLVYEYRLPVRESWIVRWLGGLTTTTVNDFRRGAEAESDRFSGEALTALREDVRALVAGEATALSEPGRRPVGPPAAGDFPWEDLQQ